MDTNVITRYRVTYSKKAALRFSGHLDMQRLWVRALRRAVLPIRYSQGFSPKACLNLASALPLGYVSSCEVLDFWMDEHWNAENVQLVLQKTIPPDLVINSICIVNNDLPSLQASVTASEFRVTFPPSINFKVLSEKMALLKAAPSIMRSKRGKTYDLVPLVEDMEAIQIDSRPALLIRMSARPGATGRPDEILDAMGMDPNDCLIERTGLIF